MSSTIPLDSDSDDEGDFSYSTSIRKDAELHEEISLWEVCDIFEEIREYITSVGLPILDSRDAVINLYDELNGR